MNRDDRSKYLLYLEPKVATKSQQPIKDEWVALIERALKDSEAGTAKYFDPMDQGSFTPGSMFKGIHGFDGQISSNQDYRLQNGLITNSLAPYYLRWYRDSIPKNDWYKLQALKDFYANRDR